MRKLNIILAGLLASCSTQPATTYPRYSTALFLSRTATDEPGWARQRVALEPSSKSILNSALVSRTDFILPPGGIVAGPIVLIFMLDSSSNRTKTPPGSTVVAFTVRLAMIYTYGLGRGRANRWARNESEFIGQH